MCKPFFQKLCVHSTIQVLRVCFDIVYSDRCVLRVLRMVPTSPFVLWGNELFNRMYVDVVMNVNVSQEIVGSLLFKLLFTIGTAYISHILLK